jgi:ubiquinone/menaquinone biosynthesis C-methylase UbiE
MIGEIVRISVALVAAGVMGSQVRKPSRWLGRPFAHLMNNSHGPLTDWGLSHVQIGEQFTILDVGCGGGRTVNKLAQKTGGEVTGVDYASGSVAASRATNKELIAAGRVHIQNASVSKLPFAADSFDLVTAVETQYYWPNLDGDMREIFRVLKPGGRLLVIAENYKGGRYDWLEGPLMRLLGSSRLSPADQRELFVRAGYAHIQIIEEAKKGWICAIGTKAAP